LSFPDETVHTSPFDTLTPAARREGTHRLNFIRQLYRAIKIVLHFTYAAVELAVTRPRTRADRAAWLSRFCARVLRAMDVTYETLGNVPTSGAVISNHLTYVDILIHSAMRPCVFVSKIELRSTPLLGWMSFMSGTVYVARGKGGSAAQAAEGMAKGFRDGLPVVFFPEGTTSVGDQPAEPFRSGLIAQTIEAGAPIRAAFISYRMSAVDLAAGKTPRDQIHWGTQTMVQHLWAFCGLHAVHGTVRFAPEPIVFSAAALADRKLAAEEAHTAVVQLSPQPDTFAVEHSDTQRVT